jgi:hypothetical protein
LEVLPLGPEANFPDRANPLIGHHHLNDDQPDESQLCRSLSFFIPVGEPRLLDISNQDTRATIDLSKQPKNTLVIAAAVVPDTIQEEDECTSWNWPCQRLCHRQQTPLSISSQGKCLAAFSPTDNNCFSIIPPLPIFDRQNRLTDRPRCHKSSREALQIRRKLYYVLSGSDQRAGPRKPQFLLKDLQAKAKILLLRNVTLLSHKLLLEIRQGLKRAAQDDQSSHHGKHQFGQAGPVLRPRFVINISCLIFWPYSVCFKS